MGWSVNINYLCFLNPSGGFVMDPKKLEDPYHVTSNFSAGIQKYFALDEYGFVVKLDDENYYHVDYNGNMTKYSNIDRFYGFNDGLSLVRNKNDSYYFINYEGDVIIDYIRR